MKHLTTVLDNLTTLKKNPTGKRSRPPPIIKYKSTLFTNKIRVDGFYKDFKPTSVKHCTIGPLYCVYPYQPVWIMAHLGSFGEGGWVGVGVEYRILCIPCQFIRKLQIFMKRHFYAAHSNSFWCQWVHTLHTKAFDAYFAYHSYQCEWEHTLHTNDQQRILCIPSIPVKL